MKLEEIKAKINKAWLDIQSLPHESQDNEDINSAIDFCIRGMNDGSLRVSEYDKENDTWVLNDFLKQAILLYFRINNNRIINFGESGSSPIFWDKVPLKTSGWSKVEFESAGFRTVPGSIIRYGAFIGSSTVIMPSFINIGAYVGSGTMIDTWATVGSCAQIGNKCHISDGVTIGGVLEPIQSLPVIIEDDCFIGARSSISEGVRICRGSVIASGVSISASTKIVDRKTREITYGYIPPYSVVVSGGISQENEIPNSKISVYCAVIIKHVDEKTRSKTSVNEILR